MVDKERNIKEQFKEEVALATDSKLKDGYGYIKKQHRLKNDELSTKRAKVEELLQHQTLVDAKEAVNTAESEESILSWKKAYLEKEMLKRFRESEENDESFGAEIDQK